MGRAAKWLVACEYLSDYRFTQDNGRGWFIFQKFRPNNRRRSPGNVLSTCRIERDQESRVSAWFTKQCPEYLDQLEVQALEDSFGSALERDIIREGRLANIPITKGGAIRQNYVWQYWRTKHS